MKLTLGYARTFLAPWVRSGMDPSATDVANSINEAIMTLMPKSEWDGTMCRMRFYIQNGTITMPREVETLIRVNIDDSPVQIFNRWYEFLSYGPGSMESNSSGCADFIDLGDGYPLHTDPHTARQVLVTADAIESNASIVIRGLDENGREVMVDGIMGEAVLLDKLMPRYSTKKFSIITHVIKPVTNGYVYLSAYDNNPLARFDIATYHPDETNPCYRRYRVNSICTCQRNATECSCCPYRLTCTAQAAVTGNTTCPTTATALVKLRFIPATHDSDVLLIQSLPSLKAMIQAQKYYDAGDADKGVKYESMAVSRLNEQLTSKEPPDNRIDYEPGFGAGNVEGVM